MRRSEASPAEAMTVMTFIHLKVNEFSSLKWPEAIHDAFY